MALATDYRESVIVAEQPQTTAPCEDRIIVFLVGGTVPILLHWTKTHTTGRTCYYLMTYAAAVEGAQKLQGDMTQDVTQYTFDSNGDIHSTTQTIATGTAIPKHRSDCGYDIEVSIDYYEEKLELVT